MEPIDFTTKAPAVGVDMFYSRTDRLWIIFAIDARGFQTGDAEYAFNRKDALIEKARFERQIAAGTLDVNPAWRR